MNFRGKLDRLEKAAGSVPPPPPPVDTEGDRRRWDFIASLTQPELEWLYEAGTDRFQFITGPIPDWVDGLLARAGWPSVALIKAGAVFDPDTLPAV